MPSLLETQKSMARALAQGPQAVPHALFASDALRTQTGLRVHANTISHARLIALEESFPRTRKRLGEAGFNRASRAFLDAGHGLDAPLALIGRRFPFWLHTSGQDRSAVLLSRFERAWLEVYHAADAKALSLPILAEFSESTLLALQVARHPAVRIVPADAALCSELELAATDLLMLTRPDEAVCAYPVKLFDAQLLERAMAAVPFATLLRFASLHGNQADTLTSLTLLMDRGALCQKDSLP